jgi:exosortase
MSTAQLSPPASTPAVASRLPSPAGWLALAVTTILVAALFGQTFALLVSLWGRDSNYSHGYLVAPISLLLAIRTYRRVGPPVRGEVALGVVGILLGLLCQSAAVVVRWPPLSYFGLVCVLRGLLVCAGGRGWASAFNFPLLFLFFMFPLPVTWTSYASLWLQDVVARVSETAIGLFYVCHRVGHTIRIAGVDSSLIVAEECSGLGQIVSFLAFAALIGYLLARPAWVRVVLIAAAVPIAILANTLRVVMMNLGTVWFGTKWVDTTLHDLPAVFSLPIGVALFLLLDHVLTGVTGRPGESAAKSGGTPDSAPPPRSGATPTRGVAVALTLLVAGVAAQFALAAHIRSVGEFSYPPLAGRLELIPLTITDPNGERLWVGQEMVEARDSARAKLPFRADDLVIRAYQNAGGVYTQLYMVYSRAGEDRKHHPEICIREVSGAPEDVRFREQVPLSDGSSAQRFRFQTSAARAVVVYYWHYTPALIADPGQTRLQTLHQRVGVSAPSVTAQLTVTTDQPAALEAVEKQLLPALDRAARERVLPAGTATGCNRIPITLAR